MFSLGGAGLSAPTDSFSIASTSEIFCSDAFSLPFAMQYLLKVFNFQSDKCNYALCCLDISARITAAAVDTLNELTFPYIGIEVI